MGYGSRAFLAGSLGFAAAFAVACGSSGSGLLTPGQSSTLASQLSAISSAVGSGRCAQAQAAATSLTNAVNNLPGSIDPTLMRNLGQGATTVAQLASSNCTISSSSSSSSSATSSSSTSSSTTPATTSSATATNPTSTSPATTSSSSSATSSSGTGTSATSNGGAGVGATTAAAGNGSGGNGVGNGNGQ